MDEIVAQDGDDRFLVNVGDGQGRILDLDQMRYFQPMDINSLLAHGDWERYFGLQDLDQKLEGVKDLGR